MTMNDNILSFVPRKALIAIISSTIGIIGIIGWTWISNVNSACADGKMDVVSLKEKNVSMEKNIEKMDKKLDRIEDKIDRLGNRR